MLEKYGVTDIAVFGSYARNEHKGKSFLYGTLGTLAGWILAIVLLLFSIPLAFLMLTSWIVVFFFLVKLFLALFFTTWCIKRFSMKKMCEKIITVLLISTVITLVMYFVRYLPSGKMIISLLAFVFIFIPFIGAIMITKYKIWSAYMQGKLKIK